MISGEGIVQNYGGVCLILGTMAGITLGCREHGETRRLACNVTGAVAVAGRPAGGIYVYLSLIGSAPSGALGAKTDEKGTYSLSVSAPGVYAVTAKWPKVTVDHGEEIEGEDRFQERYAALTRPVLQVTIHEGENTIPPIDLKR